MADTYPERQPRPISVESRRGRLIVRTLDPSDAQPKLGRNLGPAQQAPEERLQRMITNIKRWQGESGCTSWFAAIVRVSDNKNIGDSGLNEIDWRRMSGNTGITLIDAPDVRGQGYAVEAMEAVYDFAFNELGLARVEADTSADNEAMRGVFEKRMGILPDAELTDEMGSERRKADEWAKRTRGTTQTAEKLSEMRRDFMASKDTWYTVTRESWAAYGPESRS